MTAMKPLLVLLALALGIDTAAAGGGFLFVTFRDETTPLSEQVHMAVSEDGRHWEALNGGRPVLVSDVSDRVGSGAFGYVPFLTRDLGTGRFTPATGFHFPYPFRHGSVLAVTATERDRLKSAYPDQPAKDR